MPKTKHGYAHTRLYRIWKYMKRRCNNPNRPEYVRYGGRGIKVCDEWNDDFVAFKDWSENNGYRENLTIDRINNDGNYEPSNCRWVTTAIQNSNTSQNVIITYNGETNTVSYFAKKLGLNIRTALWRSEQGLSPEEILAPIKPFSFKGHNHTEESKQRIKDKLIGEKCYQYGKHLSDETKKKISEAQKGKISPKRMKLTSEQVNKMIDLRNEGYSINKISIITRIDRKIIKRTLIENGLT